MDKLIGNIFACEKLGVKAGVIVARSLIRPDFSYYMTVLSSTSSHKRFNTICVTEEDLSEADKAEYENDIIYDLLSNYQYDKKVGRNISYNMSFISEKHVSTFLEMRDVMIEYKRDTLKQYIHIFNILHKNIKIYKIK